MSVHVDAAMSIPVAAAAVRPAELVPEALARALAIVPLGFDDGVLRFACRCEDDLILRDRLERTLPTGIDIELTRVDEATLQQGLDRYYGIDWEIQTLLSRFPPSTDSDTDAESSPPAAELLELLLRDAVRRQASDLHLRTRDDAVYVRLRVDGRVYTAHRLPSVCAASLFARVKVAGALDIAESRRPQDGQGDCLVHGQRVYFRVATMPTHHGEAVVLRLFDPRAVSLRLADLQPCMHMRRQLAALGTVSAGLIVVAGPTGCGKSTTLHALVHEIDAEVTNILTLEDPVEIPVAGWQQSSIDANHAFDYAEAIRSALRQDPDVLLIGEIRDANSAAMAIRAALTGHRVYSSVHAQHAIGALYRLLELGISRGDLAMCVDAIVAQRLLGRRCGHCFGSDSACMSCSGRGITGRVAVMEILRLDDRLREALRRGDCASAFRAVAQRSGFAGMQRHAVRLHDDGIVSRSELERQLGQGIVRKSVEG